MARLRTMKMQTAMMMTKKEVKMNVKKALTMTMNDCEDGDEELSIDTLSFVQTAKKSGRAHVVPKLLYEQTNMRRHSHYELQSSSGRRRQAQSATAFLFLQNGHCRVRSFTVLNTV
mgnify:CR=1 FL=1